MKVWLVFKEYTTLDAVNEDLELSGLNVSEVVAVCKTVEKADALRVELQEQADRNTQLYEHDPVRYYFCPWEVE